MPWAKDANGQDVPTHYEIDGTIVTQIVEHKGDDVAYPVVADPKIRCKICGKVWRKARKFGGWWISQNVAIADALAENPFEAPLYGLTVGASGATICSPGGPYASAACGAGGFCIGVSYVAVKNMNKKRR